MSTVPPGVVPNYVDPPDHRQQTIILHTLCLTLVTNAVCMRLYSRFFITKSGGIDDYFIIFSWTATVAWSGVLIGSENYGIGRHLWDIPPDWLVPGLKLLFVSELIQAFPSPLLLAHLPHQSYHQYLLWAAIFAIVVFYAVTFFDTLFLCVPIVLSWDPSIDGTCQSEEALPYASSVFGFISDFYIFCLPIACIWNLNMPTSRKIKLRLAFSVGLFACVASIVRFVYTIRLVNNTDSTWDYISLSLWAVLEVDVGIVCACLHCLPAFLHHTIPNKWSSYIDSYMHRFATYMGLTNTSQSRYNSGVATNTLKIGRDTNNYRKFNDRAQEELPSRNGSAGGDEFYQSKADRENDLRNSIDRLPLVW